MIPGDRCVPWLSVLPKAWYMRPLKYAVRFNPEVLSEDTDPDELIRYVDISAVNPEGEIEHTEELRFSGAPSRARRVVRHGDVIVSTVRTYLTAIGAIRQDGLTVSTGFAVLRPAEETDSRFLAYWMRSEYIVEEIVARSTGVSYPSINPSEIGQLPIPILGLQQQGMIADFLDRETAAIDCLVGKQNRLVSSLIDKRQAVICQFVTRGLNPTAILAPSGVEWLGEVPKHWEACRIASVFREASDVGEDGLPILTVSIHDGVSDRQLDDEELERKFIRIEDSSKYKKVIPSDLVYNMMRAWQGGFGAVVVSGLVSPAYVVARPRRPMVTKFIELLLRTPAAIEEMRCHSYGVADFRLRLYWDYFKTLRVALPPLAEQREIVEAAQRETESTDALIKVIELQNEKLAEYRSALISAAVTGQIDIRTYRPQEAAALCQ